MAEHPRAWAALVVVIAVGVSRPSAGQSVLIQADASANLGYNQTTRGATQVDPNADAADRRATSTSQVFTEVRPGISLQTGSPRLTWRATYQFSGNLSLSGDHQATYGNALNAEGVAELSPNSQLTLSAAGSQGGTSFLLSQGAADTGKPEVRAPGNPSLVSGTLVESLAWQLHRHLSLQHTLLASTSAPENALSQRNSAVTASVALNLPFSRDVFGVEAHANVSWLVPLQANQRKYKTLANALLGRWNRDFSESWNGLVTAGVEQVYTATGSRPLAILPSGSASVHYTRGEMGAGLDFTHGTATNLQVGTVSLADSVTARGSVVLDSRKARSLAFSAGFLHNEPIGDINALVAAGSGNAVQADVGLTTGITRNMLGSLRYSLAYQFAQGGSIAPTLVHILFIGVTGSYRNTDQPVRKMPKHGSRVDGADSVGFPVVEEPPTE